METGNEEMEYPSAGSDPVKDPFEGIDDPTLLVQIQHEIGVIEDLDFVIKLSFVTVHKDEETGFRSTLSYYFVRGYDVSFRVIFWRVISLFLH